MERGHELGFRRNTYLQTSLSEENQGTLWTRLWILHLFSHKPQSLQKFLSDSHMNKQNVDEKQRDAVLSLVKASLTISRKSHYGFCNHRET